MNLVHELPVARQKEWLGLSLLIIGLLPVDLNTGQPGIILMTLLIIQGSCHSPPRTKYFAARGLPLKKT